MIRVVSSARADQWMGLVAAGAGADGRCAGSGAQARATTVKQPMRLRMNERGAEIIGRPGRGTGDTRSGNLGRHGRKGKRKGGGNCLKVSSPASCQLRP